MWILGQLSQAEIEDMKEQGWHVEDVNESHFNKALDPDYNPDNDLELNNHDGDKLVAVWIDNDMSNLLTQFHNEELAHNRMVEQQRLEGQRRIKAQEFFENMEMPKNTPIVDDGGWSTVGKNEWRLHFFVENILANQPTIMGKLHILFEERSTEIIDVKIDLPLQIDEKPRISMEEFEKLIS